MPRLLSHAARPAQSPVETYLREINETPVLKAEEERGLAYRINEGDSEARCHMIRANLRLVVNIARGYAGRGLELQELIEEGNLGLLRAVEGFDPSMNTRFSTYASYWIKQSMKRARENSKTIRIPAYMDELMSKFRRAAVKLQEELGRVPTEEEIGASLALPKRRLDIVKQAIRVHGAAPRSGQTDCDWLLGDTLMDANTKAPDAGMAAADHLRQVQDLLSKMDEREATVLRMRFGLDDAEPMTLKEIGDRLSLTRERIRQIEKDALGMLREQLAAAHPGNRTL